MTKPKHTKKRRGQFATSQRDYRAAMRARKFVLKQIWVHPLDWDEVKLHADVLRERRNGRC